MPTLSRRFLILAGAGAIASKIGWGAASDLHALDCSARENSISCFEPFDFKDSSGALHSVYAAGAGPPVVVLHELPGLTPEDIRLAKLLIAEGYTAVLPLLFGKPGDDRFLHSYFSICGKNQFDCDGTGRTPPPLQWIRELCGYIRKRWTEGAGIGVIGMCLTGEFPIALLNVDSVEAAVLCQPTNPFSILTIFHLGKGSSFGLAKSDLDYARSQSTIPLLGIRYSGDPLCPGRRFDELSRMMPTRFYRLDLEGHHHSSLGMDLCGLAFDEVRLYLGSRLKGTPAIDGRSFPALSKLGAIAPSPVTLGEHPKPATHDHLKTGH